MFSKIQVYIYIPMTVIVTAGIQARAPWTENATTKASFTKPRSRHQPQERHTLDFVTQLSS